MLVFLPAAAGTRIVSTDFGLSFYRGRTHANGACIKPRVIGFRELRLLMECVLDACFIIVGGEIDESRVGFWPGFMSMNNQTGPRDRRPVTRLDVGLARRARICPMQMRIIADDMRGETRPHQFFRRGCRSLLFQQRFAARAK